MSVAVAEACPKCGQLPIPNGWLTCIGCTVQLNPVQLAQVRDELGEWIEQRAAWLDEAQTILEGMPKDDPQYERGLAIWQKKLAELERTSRNHAALCWTVPA